SAGYRPKMHVIDFTEPIAALKDAVTSRYWQVVLKRLMYRAAEIVANHTGAQAIVTGESVGQVSSQTLGNLRAIEQAVSLPVLRPLIGLDKEEIISKAGTIGTAVLSARVREYCAIVPGRPVTNAQPAAARDEEDRVDLDVLREAAAARKTLDLSSLTDADLVAPYLFTEAVPEGAVVLDCREPHHYAAWHYPGAHRVSVADLGVGYRHLEKAATYVLYCSHGVQSAHLAELMQRDGYEAYSFKGGAKRLRCYVERRDV
ncbi:MAG: rhodanese-like domain-containing protein, partial [Gemmatimonadales bacterium]